MNSSATDNAEHGTRLKAMHHDELKVLARKMKLKNRSKLRKDQLVERLLEIDPPTLAKNLKITWWDKHHTHVYGAGSFILGTPPIVILILNWWMAPDEAPSVVDKHPIAKQITANKAPVLPSDHTSTGSPLMRIEAGRFQMGASRTEYPGQTPQHDVSLNSFLLGAYEVTDSEYWAVMDEEEKITDDSDTEYPVIGVSWFEAVRFCNALSKREDRPLYYEIVETKADGNVDTHVSIPDQFGTGYRLPTEAEWEYSCRAGSQARFCFGDDVTKLGDYAWYADNAPNEVRPIGKRQPNDWGLFDMHGNVYEWCWDWYSEGYYAESPRANPLGPAGPLEYRVCRGGSWGGGGEHTGSGPHIADTCRSEHRHFIAPDMGYANLGFRVARYVATTRHN